jgi:ribose 1,5-bisphosphokinase PhnN
LRWPSTAGDDATIDGWRLQVRALHGCAVTEIARPPAPHSDDPSALADADHSDVEQEHWRR